MQLIYSQAVRRFVILMEHSIFEPKRWESCNEVWAICHFEAQSFTFAQRYYRLVNQAETQNRVSLCLISRSNASSEASPFSSRHHMSVSLILWLYNLSWHHGIEKRQRRTHLNFTQVMFPEWPLLWLWILSFAPRDLNDEETKCPLNPKNNTQTNYRNYYYWWIPRLKLVYGAAFWARPTRLLLYSICLWKSELLSYLGRYSSFQTSDKLGIFNRQHSCKWGNLKRYEACQWILIFIVLVKIPFTHYNILFKRHSFRFTVRPPSVAGTSSLYHQTKTLRRSRKRRQRLKAYLPYATAAEIFTIS